MGLLQSCSENQPNDAVNVNYPPLTIGALLELHRVPFPAVDFMDEPPGKLRSVRMAAGSLQIEAAIVYSPALFSAERAWNETTVRDARIDRLVYSNVAQQKSETVVPKN